VFPDPGPSLGVDAGGLVEVGGIFGAIFVIIFISGVVFWVRMEEAMDE
jgi:hypothetical protein